MNGASYVKILLRCSAFLNIENVDKYFFFLSILAKLHPCNNSHPNEVSHYRQNFSELNFEGFDFTIGFKCRDFHQFEKLNILSINIFELNFYQDQNKWKDKIIRIEVNEINSDRIADLLKITNIFGESYF